MHKNGLLLFRLPRRQKHCKNSIPIIVRLLDPSDTDGNFFVLNLKIRVEMLINTETYSNLCEHEYNF